MHAYSGNARVAHPGWRQQRGTGLRQRQAQALHDADHRRVDRLRAQAAQAHAAPRQALRDRTREVHQAGLCREQGAPGCVRNLKEETRPDTHAKSKARDAMQAVRCLMLVYQWTAKASAALTAARERDC